jgi:AraC family transcriptional regulator
MFDEETTLMSLMFQRYGDGSVLRSGISITSPRCVINHDRIQPASEVVCESLPCRSMFTVVVYLESYIGHDMWCDAQRVALPFQSEGMVGIYDRAYCWNSVVRRPLNCVQFHFPKSRLDELTGGTEGKSVVPLERMPARLSLFDPLLKYLALACLPLLESQGEPAASHTEQIMDAVVTHVARTYYCVKAKSTFDRDRLAPWQIQKVNEIVSEKIERRLSIEDLACACALSPSHFSYLFKNTTGSAPHQWLLNRRIDLAKKLLLGTDEPLASIASASGFSDQSHFTRVFSRRVKASPSAWRRSECAHFRSSQEQRASAAQSAWSATL